MDAITQDVRCERERVIMIMTLLQIVLMRQMILQLILERATRRSASSTIVNASSFPIAIPICA
jgi:hypothetical protein